jgi:hypothetical protein
MPEEVQRAEATISLSPPSSIDPSGKRIGMSGRPDRALPVQRGVLGAVPRFRYLSRTAVTSFLAHTRTIQ